MFKYIFLGIIQGLTEFLPVSSSAHLIILGKILKIGSEQLAISVVLHLGTALALVIFFFKDILAILRSLKMLLLILIVTLITGIIGILGKVFFERLFSSIIVAAFSLGITGHVLLMVHKDFMLSKRMQVGFKDAVILGFTQAIAIIPGISRSGITMATLMFRGVERRTAFRFCFIAAIPAVFGATILEAKDISGLLKLDPWGLALGFIFSLFTGLMSLRLLKLVLDKAKLYYFGYYCITVAIITLLLLR